MGFRKKDRPGSAATMPPGETHRKRKRGPIGATGPSTHATNAKATRKTREGERALERRRAQQ